MNYIKKIIKYFFQAIFILIFLLLGRIFGLKVSRKVFAFVFSKLGPFFKSKKTIEKNLKFFSKKNKVTDKRKIIQEMWENYGKTFIEYIFLPYFRKKNSFVKIDGIDNLNRVIESKKPVIFVSGHFANFELMSMEITKKKLKLATIYRPLNNFFLNPLMEYLRKKYVCNNQIQKGLNGVRKAIDLIKKDYSIALMIDQRVSEGERINFFDEPALTTTLPAQISLKFKINIMPVFIKREKNNNFTIKFYKVLKSEDFKDKLKLTQKLNSILEDMIIQNPSQWIWTHNRWK